jgi:threonine dehydratase
VDSLITEAAAFLKGRIRRTPVEFSPGLSQILGVPVWLKLESMQLTGSFKIRGALFRISRLTEEERRDGVVTCSAGNHGKAVACASHEAGVRATICVPRSVDRAKFEGMVALGAEVRVSAFDGYDDTQDWALQIAAEQGRTFISPFDDYAVMAANGGTVAMEVLEDAPSADSLFGRNNGSRIRPSLAASMSSRLPCACRSTRVTRLRSCPRSTPWPAVSKEASVRSRSAFLDRW